MYWLLCEYIYSKTCLKRLLSKGPKIGFQDQLSLNAGQKYCRMIQGDHSAILSPFIKLPFVIKIFVLSIFEWPLKTSFTGLCLYVVSLCYIAFVQNTFAVIALKFKNPIYLKENPR